jgi:opacity protein-like surface antigen
MKKLTLSLCALVALGSVAFAGTETYSKDSKSVTPPPCPQWYADHELNLTLSGVYAFTGSEWREDRFLGVDHAWGGAVDFKYFMHRYFGFGVQGFILNANRQDFNGNDDNSNAAGGVLGTFTLRFPINCSRFAPYVWVGGGGVWNGGDDNNGVFIGGRRNSSDDSEGKAMGQFGGGLEIRFTPHFGWTNDISWNVVEGTHNNFGMARTGLNFAF